MTHGRWRDAWFVLDRRYGLFCLAYVALVYWLGSRPELATGGSVPLARAAANLFHIPLYAGLACCVLQAVSGAQGLAGVAPMRGILTLVVSAALAALDEWHQSFVPGRTASFGDLLLDLAGVASLLIVCAVAAWQELPS